MLENGMKATKAAKLGFAEGDRVQMLGTNNVFGTVVKLDDGTYAVRPDAPYTPAVVPLDNRWLKQLAKKIKWSDLALYDIDGGECPEDEIPALMREYRDTHGISDYWFIDPTEYDYEEQDEDGNDDEHSKVWDSWHNEYRWPEEAGPSSEEIDWTGLDDAIAKLESADDDE
jgi:hypothetical protein